MTYRKKGCFNSAVVYGRNQVFELIRANKRSINKIMISKTAKGTIISNIVNLAKQKKISIYIVPSKKLKKEFQHSHGVIAEVSSTKYIELSDLTKKLKNHTDQLLVILDSIKDPNNLGAIIRNCVAFNVDGVIIPKWRAAGINETISRSSAGAVEHIRISRVANINQTITFLKEHGFWIIGADNSGQTLEAVNLPPFPIALIIGSEGFGLQNLIKRNCDFLISIPQNNTISSLNASCASSIILYEISKIRKQLFSNLKK
ncbi:MAG: 23S rRNA (guanosine(2251)-2'-O)-methyltransferase RlmB [Endomicrobium sp.]|jgi:23S rRNA (guanosine2251-2'-O)-methyltransferase|nr:23S rRNA (guanosine(2251)-2'-O)-methyltransferase RlmB [Endomicrobium sp.]